MSFHSLREGADPMQNFIHKAFNLFFLIFRVFKTLLKFH